MIVTLRTVFVLAASTFLVAVHTGCHTRPELNNPDSHDVAPVNQCEVFCIKSNAVQVRLTITSDAFPYRVKNVDAAFNKDSLIKWLHEKQIVEVVYVSDYKFTRVGAENLIAYFHREGIDILEFWVPRSTRTGWLDLIADSQRLAK